MPIDPSIGKRPGTGFTPWRTKGGEHEIERVWWAAKRLEFLQENVTLWFEGSDVVGILFWGGPRGGDWCMRKPSADWQPMPAGYRERAEAEWRAWHDAQRQRMAA